MVCKGSRADKASVYKDMKNFYRAVIKGILSENQMIPLRIVILFCMEKLFVYIL